MVLGKIYRVSQKVDNQSLSILLEQRNDRSESLLFENGVITSIGTEETDSLKPMYKLITDVYGCLGCLQIAFSENTIITYLVFISGCISIGKIHHTEVFRVTDTLFVSLRNHSSDADRVQDLRKILASGAFYFSWSAKGEPMDLTLALQRQLRTQETDNRFFWNKLMFTSFIQYEIDLSKWLTKVISGSVVINTIYVGQHQLRACLLSRLSCERVGTRYNVRGVNDDGQVANFVETEQCIFLDDSETRFSSYLILRGSVPLFWEQPGVNVGSHKIRLSRGSELTQPAYDKHLITLKKAYGKLSYINLLGSKEGEAMLSKTFLEHHQVSHFGKDVPFVAFDYHAQCPKGKQDNLKKKLTYDISKQLNEFGLLVGKQFVNLKEGDLNNIDSFQNGCFRVNCVDCLDRTNSVQTFIGLWMLQKQLIALKLDDKPQVVSRVEEVFRNMWIQNGDQVSRIYAGTGALEGKNKLKDGTLSVARTIQNNLLDFSKQEAFDLIVQSKGLPPSILEQARSLLPRHYLHLPGSLVQEVCSRYLDFTEPKIINVVVGTWNVNGGKNLCNVQYKKSDPLSDWLVDYKSSGKKVDIPSLLDLSLNETMDLNVESQFPDIYAIGLEEIVDLNASNIVSASTTNQREFLVDFKETISKHCSYVLVTSTQLVGVCLYLFVRPQMANRIRDVQIDQVKTGLGGATGNKGAVAIRLQLDASRLCFVCSHFAAGQNHVEERNSDYTEISRKINFNIGSGLAAHDYVFWCGDFNYRIDLPNEEARALAEEGDVDTLFENDQLRKEHQEGKIFHEYLEGKINFLPTYKYDSFCNDYDTSEKCRIPAWTDRVLFKKQTATRKSERDGSFDYGKIVHYGRAELKTSDHRPVIAEFQCEIIKVNEQKRDEIIENVLSQSGPTDCTLLVQHPKGKNAFTHNLIGKLLLHFEEFGEIALTRFANENLNVIFKQSRSALKASKQARPAQFDSELTIRLKNENWIPILEKQIALVKSNLISMCDGEQIESDGDFFSTSIGPSCDPNSFCIDDEIESPPSNRESPDDEEEDSSTSESIPLPVQRNTSAKPPSRPPPPSRPTTGSTTAATVRSPTSPSEDNESVKPIKLVPVRPPPPPPITTAKPLKLNDSFDLPPPPMAPPLMPKNASDAFDNDDENFGPPPPLPPPRIDSFEDGFTFPSFNSTVQPEEPLLSPWQSLPPAPPTPPKDYPPPPVPSRPPPTRPLNSHNPFAAVPTRPPPSFQPPNIPTKAPPNIPPPLPPTSLPPSVPPPPLVPQRPNSTDSTIPQIPARIKPMPKN